MSPALERGLKKALRTIAQLAAGGALTALVTAAAGGLTPTVAGLVLGAWTALVAFTQNWAETAGAIPTLLPTAAVVIGPTGGAAVATVDAAADKAGGIAGDVVDTTGGIVGEVTGQLDPPSKEGPA